MARREEDAKLRGKEAKRLGREEREAKRKIEKAVEQAAGELVDRYHEPIRANPGLKLIEIINPGDPMALWFTYGLIVESRRLRWLTVVLVIITAVLAYLTLRLGTR